MNRDKNNRKIAEWLGVPCWHEMKGGCIRPAVCTKCDFRISISHWQQLGRKVNPDYYTPEGFVAKIYLGIVNFTAETIRRPTRSLS